MKKQIVTAATFAACLALYAAVWLQAKPVDETPAAPTLTAVTATKPEVTEIPEIEEIIMPEKENIKVAEPDLVEADAHAPELPQTPTPPEKSVAVKQEPEAPPTSPDTPPDNRVYVEGFGWLENQGPNYVEYAEDMYENGNKIGIMG